jgi:hypothetical protein
VITTGLVETDSRPPRAVYVVVRTANSHGQNRFVAAELTPSGGPREHATSAAAHAVANRMGGRAAGVLVLEEWRTQAGTPCYAPRVEG